MKTMTIRKKTNKEILDGYIDGNGYSLGDKIRKNILMYLNGFGTGYNDEDIYQEVMCEVQSALGN